MQLTADGDLEEERLRSPPFLVPTAHGPHTHVRMCFLGLITISLSCLALLLRVKSPALAPEKPACPHFLFSLWIPCAAPFPNAELQEKQRLQGQDVVPTARMKASKRSLTSLKGLGMAESTLMKESSPSAERLELSAEGTNGITRFTPSFLLFPSNSSSFFFWEHTNQEIWKKHEDRHQKKSRVGKESDDRKLTLCKLSFVLFFSISILLRKEKLLRKEERNSLRRVYVYSTPVIQS